MRKWFVSLLLLLVLCFGAVYLFIPNKVTLQQKEQVSFSSRAFSRGLFNEATWRQWWPEKSSGTSSLSYNGNVYTLREKKVSSLAIDIHNGNDTLGTELVAIPISADSLELNWLGVAGTSGNPVARLQKNRWAKDIASDMKVLLQRMKTFYTKPENIYSLPVKEVQVVDSTLISISASVKQYPTTDLIYSLLDKLKTYAAEKGARQTGLPMLNITHTGANNYLTRVALPVDKKLPNEGAIQYRWMLGGGNILVTEVRGGPHGVEKAFGVLEEYIADFKRVAPAIPFQSLVTDRRSEPDTNKWVTKVYWPVM